MYYTHIYHIEYNKKEIIRKNNKAFAHKETKRDKEESY